MKLQNILRNYFYWRLLLPASWARDAVLSLNTPLPWAIKMKIIWSSTVLSARRLLPHPNKPTSCGIVGFNVSAYSLNTLSYLHREIFVNLEYYFPFPTNSPLIVDCGSNIGISVLFFKTLYPDSKIIGFEPSAETYSLLKDNVSRNNLTDVTIYQNAVGDTDGSVTFFNDILPGSPVASTNPKRMSTKSTTVEQVRLSRFINADIDLLKLDVEGAEYKVLMELSESGAISKIRNMIIEYHHHIDEKEDSFSRFLSILESNSFGYQIAANLGVTKRTRIFQDFLIYAYQK